MVAMMFNCLPKDEKGLSLAEQLEEQYNNHKINGVTYTLEGQTINEKHFNFSVLINALQAYKDIYDAGDWHWPQLEKHWCTEVGAAQCYMPAHVMQHYCEPDVPFDPLPKFKVEQFVRTLKFLNYVNQSEMNWSGITPASKSVLGEDFAITRRHRGPRGCGLASRGEGITDVVAIKTLCEVRISDYLAIPSKLASLFKNKAAVEESPYSCVIS
jgi:hypothetical protein